MGGMIVQTMAMQHPERVRSLTTIMSTTGKRTVGWQHPRLLPHAARAAAPGREAYVDGQRADVAADRLAGLPGDRARRSRERAGETFDRGVSASGALRQMLAIVHPAQPRPAAPRAAGARRW